MPNGQESETLPGVTRGFLNRVTADLRRKKANRVRITPLLIRVPAAELVHRRNRLFAELTADQADWGLRLSFRRKVRPTAAHPNGRVIAGDFAVVTVDESLCLLVSTLSLDAHTAGPHRLCKKAYPLAKRPFFTANVLAKTVGDVATDNSWNATAIDAMGYDHARRFRRDMREQSVEDALAEMREQGRYVHRLEVSFTDKSSSEVLRASFDRYASVSMRRGDVVLVVSGFVRPAVAASRSKAATYAIDVNPRPRQQQVVQLSFPHEPFRTYADMNALCDALRRGDGLAVTILHLNPYLQAQVVDMLTGAAADMIIVDKSRVSLIPRSRRSAESLERMTSTLLRHFGEAQVEKVPVS